MQWWSVSAFAVSTVAVGALANAGAFLAWRRADQALTRALAELDHRSGALYPATLLAYGWGRHDTTVTGWAAVHRARRPLPDGERDHPLTALAREVVARGLPQDITEVTGRPDFLTAHHVEAEWLADRMPGPGDDSNLGTVLVGLPAAAISGWMALCAAANLISRLMRPGVAHDTGSPDDASGPYGGVAMIGLLVWLAGFVVMLAVEALLWLPARDRWRRRVRDHSAQLVQRELGDAHDAFLADLSRDAAATLRPRHQR
ncbi:hypothetical protein [Kitasatospora sp. P5_F3]